MSDRLYLDNAATSFPKPPAVFEAMGNYAQSLGASAGRGAYREAVETGHRVQQCRQRLAKLIGAASPDYIAFSLNCTQALNTVIKGVLREGDHVVTTVMDHNSVLRPLNGMTEAGQIETTLVPADSESGRVLVEDVLSALRPKTRLVCMSHGSNVTGTLQPIAEVGEELQERGILFLVDAAQTAGHIPCDVNELGADFVAMPGHKGL